MLAEIGHGVEVEVEGVTCEEVFAGELVWRTSKTAAVTTIPVVIAHAFGRASILLGHHLQQWVRFD